MDKPIDIVLVTYERELFTKKVFSYLRARTNTPYRIIQVDNGSKKQYYAGDIVVKLDKNYGLETALNHGLHFVESDFFVTIDNDILVPQYSPDDWLIRLVRKMNTMPDYGAIALRPQVLVGVGQIFKDVPKGEVVENNVCGGVARMMRKSMVDEVGGWTNQWQNEGRGNEEWDICNKLRAKGWKVGYLNLYAYHMFGNERGVNKKGNWGYNLGEEPSHSIPECPYDVDFDPVTCEPKQKCNE